MQGQTGQAGESTSCSGPDFDPGNL